MALAIPAIVANITTPLLSLVDLAIVGHLGSPVYVGAIAIGGTVFNMLYWLFGFLRFGTSGLTAQAYGAGNRAEQSKVGLRALLVAVMLGLALVSLQYPIKCLSFEIMRPDEAIRPVAEVYFNILIYGAPAVLIQYSLTGWFVGVQNTRVPMYVSLFVNVVNIALSLLFVYVCDMGIKGVAYGSLIAQWSGCFVALAAARLPMAQVRYAWNVKAIRRFFSINADIFLRTLCLIAVTVWFTRSGAEQGAIILSVNTLLMQLFTLFSYFMDGFAFAAEALCGKYYGAADMAGLRRCMRRFVQWGLVMAGIFTAIYAIGGHSVIAMLTDDVVIRSAAADYSCWAVLVPICGFLAFTADGFAIGLTRTRTMFLSMLASTMLFFGLYFLLVAEIGNHALWIAFIAYLLGRGVLLFARLNYVVCRECLPS